VRSFIKFSLSKYQILFKSTTKTSTMKFLYTLSAFLISSVCAESILRTGGSRMTTVSDENKAILLNALGNATNYGPNVRIPICVSKIYYARERGTKYYYLVEGCGISFNDALGECGERDCLQLPFTVSIEYQPSTNKYQVQQILRS
jgi:hypothetical protein